MKRQYLFIACLASIAIVGAFFLGRAKGPAASQGSEGGTEASVPISAKVKATVGPKAAIKAPSAAVDRSSPLPPQGTPLKSIFADLQERANSGDSAAASRLVRDLARCSRLDSVIWKNARTTESITSRNPEGMSEEQLRTYQMMLDSMETRQKEAQRVKDLCAGVDKSMMDSLVSNLAQAGQLGDTNARSCYLNRGPTFDPRNMLDHPELLQNYRDSASAMIDAGLAAGDWRTVDLLKSAYEPGAQGMLAGLVGADPVQYYRYLKLYRLGAEPFRAAALDLQLAAAAASLKPEQVAVADQWAQATLQSSFRGPSTAATPQGWDACAGIGH